ncbi:hypothetical protein J6590_097153 [Homalodisca vitripennis]|nr:hypothetical protein J6590_097153 [Homalodisca vitripennis]
MHSNVYPIERTTHFTKVRCVLDRVHDGSCERSRLLDGGTIEGFSFQPLQDRFELISGTPIEVETTHPIIICKRHRSLWRRDGCLMTKSTNDTYFSCFTYHCSLLSADFKPRLRNHYRAHRLSFWLNLVPQLLTDVDDDQFAADSS